MERYKLVELHRSIFNDFGRALHSDCLILDFGCGDGEMVQQYRHSGLQAFGVDVTLEKETEFLRLIPGEASYRIPFVDNTFDFLLSTSVLEHVENLDSALAEMYRVLKPGGASLHIFPARAKPIEPHVLVPLAGILRNRPWLLLWALLGVRNQFQRGKSFLEVARWNHAYLQSHTFYRSRGELRTQIVSQFGNLIFAERQMIRHSYGRARHLSPFVESFPIVASLYGFFHNQCVFFAKPRRL